jgi:8-oxo-dGTP pyrophosphatase MutT (NUDIX family)
MPDWPSSCYQRAVAFVTDPVGRLLVFDHVDSPDAGTQVPAGGIEPGERPDDAVVRELAEESGITTARVVRKLGESWFVADPGSVPAGYEEQVHHAYHLHLDHTPAQESWEWDECSGGDVVQHRYAFRWVEIDADPEGLLCESQTMWFTALRCSFERL